MPPALWKVLHNRLHHTQTNSLKDPDRSFLAQQPKTWGKWLQNWAVPSIEVNLIGLIVGIVVAWLVYAARNLSAVLLFNQESVDYVPAAVTVSAKERRAIAKEFLLIVMVHLSILTYLRFDPLKLLLGYLIPLGSGYAIWFIYIYTNHFLCQLTSINDPLVNTVSVQIPQLFNVLHLNFSYHTEHHLFPGMNSTITRWFKRY